MEDQFPHFLFEAEVFGILEEFLRSFREIVGLDDFRCGGILVITNAKAIGARTVENEDDLRTFIPK